MEEIAFFEQVAPVEDDALPPVLDVEATPTSPTCHRHLTQAGAIADMKVMLEEMERHYGKRPVIYTTVDFYQAILSNGAFMDYPIWVRSTKYRPAVKYGLRPWHFWQYQSDGRVAGIQAHVDQDAFLAPRSSGTPSSAMRNRARADDQPCNRPSPNNRPERKLSRRKRERLNRPNNNLRRNSLSSDNRPPTGGR